MVHANKARSADGSFWACPANASFQQIIEQSGTT